MEHNQEIPLTLQSLPFAHVYDEIAETFDDTAAAVVNQLAFGLSSELDSLRGKMDMLDTIDFLRQTGVIWDTTLIHYYSECVYDFLEHNPSYRGLEPQDIIIKVAQQQRALTHEEYCYITYLQRVIRYEEEKELWEKARLHHPFEEGISVLHPSFRSYWMAKVA